MGKGVGGAETYKGTVNIRVVQGYKRKFTFYKKSVRRFTFYIESRDREKI